MVACGEWTVKEEILTDALLRDFLLGKVDDEERVRIESLFLTDPEAREKILVIEQELVEDYLEDSLTVSDREEFLSRYGQTAAQLQQLRITKAIKDWAVRENALGQTVSDELSIWSRLRARLRLKPAFVIPIAVTAMIAIVVAGVWLNSRMKRAALEQELAQLNTPASLREVPEPMFSLNLSPVAVRSTESQIVIKRPAAATAIVELHLPWIQTARYSTYHAEIRRVGGDESFTIPNLQPENSGRYEIRLRFPARIINRGQYQVRLSGIDSGGAEGTSEEYTFIVDG
jgi:hypothetical protein